MAGLKWSDEEECLIIWFASARIPHGIISVLLNEKGFDRTMTSIRNKISAIRKQNSLGEASHQLIELEVDRWIGRLSPRINIDQLLTPTLQDQQILDQVR